MTDQPDTKARAPLTDAEWDRIIAAVYAQLPEREVWTTPHGWNVDDRLTFDMWRQAISTVLVQARAELAEARAALQTAEQERDEVIARAEKMTDLRLLSAGPTADNEFAISLASDVWPLIVNALACWFVKQDGKNYVEFKAEYDTASLTGHAPAPVGPFVITMQRLHGKSPNDLRLEAEQRAEQAEAEIARLTPLARLGQQVSQLEQVRRDLLAAIDAAAPTDAGSEPRV